MEPSPKSPRLEALFESLFGRTTAITTGHCAPAPMGCGREVDVEEIGTWPVATQKDYPITGLCWQCQRRVYDETDECTCDTPCCSVDVGVGYPMTCGGQHCPVHGG